MMRKLILLLCLIASMNIVEAQTNYYYYLDDFGRDRETRFLKENVYAINLETGEKKRILTNVGIAHILSDNSKIVFRSIPGSMICIYDTKTEMVDTLTLQGAVEDIYAHFLPGNRIYMGHVKMGAKVISIENKQLEITDVIIDKQSYSVVDTSCFYKFNIGYFLSRNGLKLFKLIKSTDGIYFQSRNTTNGDIIDEKFLIDAFFNLGNSPAKLHQLILITS